MGQILGVLIGGVLYDGNGLKYDGYGFSEGPLFFIASAIMITSIIPMLLLVPEGGVKRSWNIPEQENNKNAEELENSQKFSITIFLYFIFALFIINAGRNSISIVFSQYLTLETGIAANPKTLSYILNTRGIAMILMGLIAGKFSNKIGFRKTLVISALISALYLFIFSQVVRTEYIFIGTAIWGICDVLIGTSSYALASLLIPSEKRARLFGVYNASFFLSWGVGSTFIIGPVIDLLIKKNIPIDAAYRSAFLISSMITLLGLVLLLLAIFIEKKRGKNYGEAKKIISEKLQD